MDQSYKAINSQYAVQQSLPIWGDLEGWVGMYYYSARYYAPPTFISRDPLMDEKPWLTPYHYCSNNPVNKVDPSGMLDTDFGVMPNGKVKQIGITNNDPDRLFALDENANKKNDVKPITVTNTNILPTLAGKSNIENKDYWTPSKIKTTTTIVKTGRTTFRRSVTTEVIEPPLLKGHYAKTKSGAEARNLFKFLGTHSDVEWSCDGYKNGDWLIGTLHQSDQAPMFSVLGSIYSEHNRIYDSHSHGTYYGGPSGNDLMQKPKGNRWLFEPRNPDPSKRMIKY